MIRHNTRGWPSPLKTPTLSDYINDIFDRRIVPRALSFSLGKSLYFTFCAPFFGGNLIPGRIKPWKGGYPDYHPFLKEEKVNESDFG
ncbi:MAG: hypothetical protein GY861_21860 [bacterium]|nr:hypothetical protein [bacterium]